MCFIKKLQGLAEIFVTLFSTGDLFEEVTKIDMGSTVDIVDMDFGTAFDNVPHGRPFWKVRLQEVRARKLT